MKKFKPEIKQSKKGIICSLTGILCSILGIVLYIITTKVTNGAMSNAIIALSLTGTMLALISMFLIYLEGVVSMVSAAVFLFSMCMFVSSQADNIGYALAGISDIGYGIQFTLVIGVILYLLAVICESIAVFDKNEKLHNQKVRIKKEKKV